MIAHLSGTLLEKQVQRLVVDVGGVGYEVIVPLSTFYAAGEPGARVALRVHTHVREDALQLFGFSTPLELQLFERLISVNGVGPKLALAVLSGIEALDLVTAIRQADVVRLTRIPGVGKKTAERIIVELRDRLPKVLVAEVAGSVPPASEDLLRDDLVSALANLGYHQQAIDKVLERVLKDQPAPQFEDALRAALRELARA